MNKLLAVLLVSSLALPLFAEKDAKKEEFKSVSVEELAAALKTEKAPVVLDANNKDTREKHGVIPGAVLLESSKKFNVKKVLPADKEKALVFYCANVQCMASHKAAKRALKAGYKDVSILPAGIIGWKEAGQPVQTQAPKQ